MWISIKSTRAYWFISLGFKSIRKISLKSSIQDVEPNLEITGQSINYVMPDIRSLLLL